MVDWNKLWSRSLCPGLQSSTYQWQNFSKLTGAALLLYSKMEMKIATTFSTCKDYCENPMRLCTGHHSVNLTSQMEAVITLGRVQLPNSLSQTMKTFFPWGSKVLSKYSCST